MNTNDYIVLIGWLAGWFITSALLWGAIAPDNGRSAPPGDVYFVIAVSFFWPVALPLAILWFAWMGLCALGHRWFG